MKQINLMDYILNDQKIILAPNIEEKRVSRKKHFFKFFLCTLIDFTFCIMIHQTFIRLMNIKINANFKNYFLKIQNEHSLVEIFLGFSIVLAAYIFSFFFFNNGQTLGLKFLGLRYNMKPNKLISFFKNSGMYFSVCLSWGLLNFLKVFQNKIIPHDDLYIKLFQERDFKYYKLIDQIHL